MTELEVIGPRPIRAAKQQTERLERRDTAAVRRTCRSPQELDHVFVSKTKLLPQCTLSVPGDHAAPAWEWSASAAS